MDPQQKIAQLEKSIIDMNALVQNLQLQLEEARQANRSAQQVTSVQLPEPKVQLPEPFHGDRKSLRGFLNQLRLVWQLQPRQYHSDALKVGLLGTLLCGAALRWFTPLLETQDQRLNDVATVID
jgi:hypothetical protein